MLPLLRHSAGTACRRIAAPAPHSKLALTPLRRTFGTSITRRDANAKPPHEGGEVVPEKKGKMIAFEDVRTIEDLLPPGAEPGTMPTDENQSTGLERLEILGKMQGVDVFDMRPLDASRKGTLDNPILVYSAGDEQYAGCTGYPVDSHWTIWLGMDRKRPVERCTECGSVYRMEYIGPPDDPHDEHGHGHGHAEGEKEYDVYRDGHPDLIAEQNKPRFAELVRPEYR